MAVSLDNIADNYFHCGETPLWFPPDVNSQSLRVSNSTVVRVSAPLQGVVPALHPHPYGCKVDETALASFFYNGLQYSLSEAFLYLPGLHRLPNRPAPEVVELCLFFVGGEMNRDIRCLCIPVQVGSGRGTDYFSELGKSVSSRKTTLESLLDPTSSLVMYVGKDVVRGREKGDRMNDCNTYTRVTYFVCQSPAFLHEVDLQRIRGLTAGVLKGPPEPLNGPASAARIQTLVTVLPSMKVGAKDGQNAAQKPVKVTLGDTVTLKQMKCRPLDVDKDIQNGTIYIGGKRASDSTLEDELQKAAALSKSWEDQGTVLPGDIENVLGGVLGVGIAITIVAFLVFLVMMFVYRDYEFVLTTLYDKSKNPVVRVSAGLATLFRSAGSKAKSWFC